MGFSDEMRCSFGIFGISGAHHVQVLDLFASLSMMNEMVHYTTALDAYRYQYFVAFVPLGLRPTSPSHVTGIALVPASSCRRSRSRAPPHYLHTSMFVCRRKADHSSSAASSALHPPPLTLHARPSNDTPFREPRIPLLNRDSTRTMSVGCRARPRVRRERTRRLFSSFWRRRECGIWDILYYIYLAAGVDDSLGLETNPSPFFFWFLVLNMSPSIPSILDTYRPDLAPYHDLCKPTPLFITISFVFFFVFVLIFPVKDPPLKL